MSGTLDVLRRAWRTSPELREGAGRTVALALLAAGGRVTTPVVVQQLLDRGLREGGGAVAVLTALGFAAVTAASLSAASTRRRLARAGESALCSLRVRAFRHVHRLSMATLTEERRGSLVARVTSDVEVMSQFLSWGGIMWLVDGALVTAVLAVMAGYDWRLTLVAVAVLLPMVALLRALQGRLSSAYDAVRARVAELVAVSSEAVVGAPVVRAYGAQERVRERAEAAIERSRRAGVRAGVLGAVLFPTGDVFSVFTVVAVLGAGLVLGPAGGLSIGELVAFVFLVLLLLEPVAEFTEVVDQTQTAVAGCRRVLEVLDTPVDVPEPNPGRRLPAVAPDIVLERVSFAYGREPGAPLALDDVSLAIPAGARVAVVGPTGSGKTTLAKLLTRLADPSAGRILVAGIDLREVAADSLRSTLVMVPQEGFLFDTDVLDNVRFGRPDANDEEVRLAFVELGLEQWLDGLPAGLQTHVGQRGEHLSVGERQLVSLARAYVAHPPCLILDEATSAVDPATDVRLTRAVESLTRGRTSVTIAHRLATAERADLVVVLEGGRVVDQGTHAELLAREGAYARLHRHWTEGVRSAGALGR